MSLTQTAFLMLPVISQVSLQVLSELLQRLAIFALILLVTWALERVLGSFISRTVGRFSQSVARQSRRFTALTMWLVGILVGLYQLGLELTVVLAIVSLGAILMIIALRDVLSGVASHEVITTYNPFKIGDWIQVDEHFGRVVEITWMDTILMTPDSEMVYIPNSKITQSVVTNRTTPGGTRMSVPLTLRKSVDLSKVEAALLDIGAELREELVPDSNPEVRIIDIDEDSTKLVLLLKINNPAKGSFIASEVRRKIRAFLDQNGGEDDKN